MKLTRMSLFDFPSNPNQSLLSRSIFLACLLGLTGGSSDLAELYDSPPTLSPSKQDSPHGHRNIQHQSPDFVTRHSPNVTAIQAKTALLNCRVRSIGNKTVSWIRHSDTQLLAIGRYTYTSDQRFKAIHKVRSEDYLLQIKPLQAKDGGLYECQISTTPVMSHYIYLTVAEPVTEIVGGPEIHLDEGSTMNLTCIVRDSPEPPHHIFWYHNKQSISYNSARGGVSQITEKGDVTASFLLIQKARLSDSGPYSCEPSLGHVANVTVHVIRGNDPAKWQTNTATILSSFFSLSLFLVFYFPLSLYFCFH